MAKSAKAKTADRSWTTGLDVAEVRAALEEAIVDCYGESEQHTGLVTAIQDELTFPFKAKVMGEAVTVTGVEWSEGDEFGLDLVCERGGKAHRIEARSVELVKPLPDGHLFLAAYLEWKRML